MSKCKCGSFTENDEGICSLCQIVLDARADFRDRLVAAVRERAKQERVNFLLSHDVIALISTFPLVAEEDEK